ncbi:MULTISPECIES: Crp/Fnr family transcriptional regulator [Sphingobacterium]|uniref:Crp/Fnr family transcriptional regulator n=1 Tax=Sphingobacterium TaxID=28453 RepID=UPI0015529577|nr:MULTISPECIES: Crp/Fnr family transcriptional regulator [Sphingobacterium]MDM1295312.1 Crp/Fnr family transcriptional regulator [Sphingobacterium sp. N143]NPE45488.1 Crp/Fnr family transcriptional regulator [Sphingobacterium prati]
MLRKHIEDIVPLNDDEFQFIKEFFDIKFYKKGSFIIEVDQHVKHVFLVKSGLLKLIYHDSSGKEHIISFAMEEWWETDYSAWFSGHPAKLSLKCIEHTEVYCLSLDSYHILCSKLQKMESFFLHKANRGHLASQNRILSFLTDSPHEKYSRLLSVQPALIQRVPKATLAAYLGLSRETLSRLWRTSKANRNLIVLVGLKVLLINLI